MSDFKIHPVTKQTLAEFLEEKEKEFLSEVAKGEELEKAKENATNTLADAEKLLLVASKSKIELEEGLVQATFQKRLAKLRDDIQDIIYTYCR